jgi:dTDP-glucose 4,6-dehydratase
VTGGAGFIGSSFVAQRAQAGQKVIVLDALTYAGHRENLEGLGKNVELVVGNITDGPLIESLLKKHQVEALVHFAAESHVDNSITGSAIFIETNIIGTYRLLEAARQYWNGLEAGKKERFRFLQVSTDEVYGELELDDPARFDEESRLRPNSPYSASKAAGDCLARAWFHTYGLPVITTNCTNNYGPRQFPEKMIPVMITHALSGKPLPVYGDGKNVRDWIHVEDHAAGVYLAVTKGKPGEVYCFGGNAEKNNLEVVHAICAELDAIRPRKDSKSYAEQIAFVKDRPGHDRRYAIDDSKAVKELGYTRRYKDFKAGLKATVAWYLENTEWCRKVTSKKKAA